MAKKTTDKQRKKIVADYVECGNYSEVARKHKMSSEGVRRIVQNDTESWKKLEHKKEENSKDMIEYLDSKKTDAFKFIDMAMEGMMNKEKIDATSINLLATSIGIMIDKFTKNASDSSAMNITILNDIGKKDDNNKT